MRPKACAVFYSPKSGIVSSKPSRGVYVCLKFSVSVLFYVARGLAMGRTSTSLSPPPRSLEVTVVTRKTENLLPCRHILKHWGLREKSDGNKPLQIALEAEVIKHVETLWTFGLRYCSNKIWSSGSDLPEYTVSLPKIGLLLVMDMGRDSSVSIATCYMLDGPGIESHW